MAQFRHTNIGQQMKVRCHTPCHRAASDDRLSMCHVIPPPLSSIPTCIDSKMAECEAVAAAAAAAAVSGRLVEAAPVHAEPVDGGRRWRC